MESVRYFEAKGDPPLEPDSYDSSYRLPQHRRKLLQDKFHHELDDNIVFYEKQHVYTVKGKCTGASVSGLYKAYVNPFDAPKTIRMMQFSKKEAWPRYKYAINPVLVDADFRNLDATNNILYLSEDDKTVYSGPVSEAPDVPNGFRVYKYERGMTENEILERWNDPEARNRGTEAHYMMELWMNSEACRTDQPEVKIGLAFVEKQLAPNQIKAYRTEWEIYATEEDVAGSVDFVGVLPNGDLVIVDWKRSPTLQEKLTDKFNKKMKSPLDHLDDCDGAKYAIQLSAYAWILEKYYGKKVVGLALCSIHPDAPFHTWVPYLKQEVAYLMASRSRDVCRKEILEAVCSSLPRCTFTNKIAFDAVLCGGKIYNEKDLSIRSDEPYTSCTSTRKLCSKELSNVSLETPFVEEEALQEAVSWKSRMPATGINDFRRL